MPPGPPRRSSLSLLRARRRDPLGLFTGLARDHGDAVRFRLGPYELTLLSDPDHAQEVLVGGAGQFRKGRMLEGARVILGDGLLTSEGDAHRRARRLVQPAFGHDRLAGYAEVMVAHAERAGARWREGVRIDVASEMPRLAAGIVAESLFGADLEAELGSIETDLADVLRALDLLVLPFAGVRMRVPTRTVRRFRAARERLEETVRRIVAERRAGGAERDDLLAMLLAAQDEDGGRMSDEQVRDEIMTLVAAGLETTANALVWTWCLLAREPAAEERLGAELDAALAGRRPEVGDLPHLTYTDHVLTEAIRLYPPAWMIGRRCVGETAIGGWRIPEGSLVLVSPWIIHRDARHHPQPERFDPDRWAPGASEGRHRFAYLPFGGGVRKCIGSGFATMEGVLVLATLARDWRLRLDGPFPEPLPQITLRARGPVWMTPERR